MDSKFLRSGIRRFWHSLSFAKILWISAK